MRVVGYVLLAALGVLVLLLLAAVIRTLCNEKKTSDYTPHPDAAREREYAEKLSRMVAYETVSHPDDPKLEKFRGFHKLLAELYPTVHEKLEKTEIDGNLLFFWEGKTTTGRSCSCRIRTLSGGGNVGARAVLRRHRRRQGLGPRRFRHKVQRHGLFPGVRGAAAGRVRPRAGRVPLVFLHGGVRRGPAGGKLVDELRRRGVKPFLVATRAAASSPSPSAASWKFRHARRV